MGEVIITDPDTGEKIRVSYTGKNPSDADIRKAIGDHLRSRNRVSPASKYTSSAIKTIQDDIARRSLRGEYRALESDLTAPEDVGLNALQRLVGQSGDYAERYLQSPGIAEEMIPQPSAARSVSDMFSRVLPRSLGRAGLMLGEMPLRMATAAAYLPTRVSRGQQRYTEKKNIALGLRSAGYPNWRKVAAEAERSGMEDAANSLLDLIDIPAGEILAKAIGDYAARETMDPTTSLYDHPGVLDSLDTTFTSLKHVPPAARGGLIDLKNQFLSDPASVIVDFIGGSAAHMAGKGVRAIGRKIGGLLPDSISPQKRSAAAARIKARAEASDMANFNRNMNALVDYANSINPKRSAQEVLPLVDADRFATGPLPGATSVLDTIRENSGFDPNRTMEIDPYTLNLFERDVDRINRESSNRAPEPSPILPDVDADLQDFIKKWDDYIATLPPSTPRKTRTSPDLSILNPEFTGETRPVSPRKPRKTYSTLYHEMVRNAVDPTAQGTTSPFNEGYVEPSRGVPTGGEGLSPSTSLSGVAMPPIDPIYEDVSPSVPRLTPPYIRRNFRYGSLLPDAPIRNAQGSFKYDKVYQDIVAVLNRERDRRLGLDVPRIESKKTTDKPTFPRGKEEPVNPSPTRKGGVTPEKRQEVKERVQVTPTPTPTKETTPTGKSPIITPEPPKTPPSRVESDEAGPPIAPEATATAKPSPVQEIADPFIEEITADMDRELSSKSEQKAQDNTIRMSEEDFKNLGIKIGKKYRDAIDAKKIKSSRGVMNSIEKAVLDSFTRHEKSLGYDRSLASTYFKEGFKDGYTSKRENTPKPEPVVPAEKSTTTSEKPEQAITTAPESVETKPEPVVTKAPPKATTPKATTSKTRTTSRKVSTPEGAKAAIDTVFDKYDEGMMPSGLSDLAEAIVNTGIDINEDNITYIKEKYSASYKELYKKDVTDGALMSFATALNRANAAKIKEGTRKIPSSFNATTLLNGIHSIAANVKDAGLLERMQGAVRGVISQANNINGANSLYKTIGEKFSGADVDKSYAYTYARDVVGKDIVDPNMKKIIDENYKTPETAEDASAALKKLKTPEPNCP